LEFCWNLTATFRDDSSMQYTIEPNDYRISQGTLRRWWSAKRWSKKAMAIDVERLAVLIKELL